MRKITFYPKLALGNLWRNKSTYLPYLLACIVSVFTFYNLLAMNMNDALNGMRGESVVKSFTLIGTIILGIFCTILIFYTNSFLIKRRKRELGLYSILGMEKKNIAVLLFFETLFVSAIALITGLGLGMLLSQLIFWGLLRLTHYPVALNMPVMPEALALTATFFAVVFALTLLSNMRQVRLANPIDLMAGAKQGEREPKASWLLTVIGILCLAGGYFIALYFSSPIEALMFFLAAVLLVIIGTYCLFTSGSVAMLKLLRKNKKYYYQPRHFVSVSGMIYRMKQNAAGLATICILSCMVLVTLSATVAMNVGAEDSLLQQYPRDYQLSFGDPVDGDLLLAAAEQTAEKTGVQLEDVADYRSVSMSVDPQGDVLTSTSEFNNITAVTLLGMVPLEDYNRDDGENVSLAADEALLFVTGGSYTADTLTFNGTTWRVRHLESLAGEQSGHDDIGRVITLVMPTMADIEAAMATHDALLNDGTVSRLRREISFDLAGEETGKEAFHTTYDAYVNSEELSTNQGFSYRSREGGREGWYASNGGFLFLGIYFGILFLMAAAMIIYYKQISEGYDDADRYEILQKVGMSEDEVQGTINGQILAVFFLPLLVAILHIVVAFFPISRVMVIFGVLNTPLLVVATLATVLAYALVYLLVYRRTAKTYFRIVRRHA